jgi:predicted RNA-binding Zn ribbon-like protein
VSTLPTWYPWPETETKPAPMPLLLVQAFVNTLDAEKGVDLLDDADTAKAWFVDTGMLGASAKLSPPDLEQAKAVRECIRGLLARADPKPGVKPLREVAGSRSPELTIGDDGQVELENPGFEEVVDGLFRLLIIMRRAQEDGTWSRLRVCANDECRWAFYDRSRNQHGSWCDMATCGNRLKNRELRARKRR